MKHLCTFQKADESVRPWCLLRRDFMVSKALKTGFSDLLFPINFHERIPTLFPAAELLGF